MLFILQDYSNDWSPSDTVRRLRKGKVRLLGKNSCGIFGKLASLFSQGEHLDLSLVLFVKRSGFQEENKSTKRESQLPNLGFSRV